MVSELGPNRFGAKSSRFWSSSSMVLELSPRGFGVVANSLGAKSSQF